VPPQPAQERKPSRRSPWHQGPGDADCRWNLFSMYCRPVGQVIFANWLATTSAMSGKSPIHSSRRLVPGSRLAGTDLALTLDSWRITGYTEVGDRRDLSFPFAEQPEPSRVISRIEMPSATTSAGSAFTRRKPGGFPVREFPSGDSPISSFSARPGQHQHWIDAHSGMLDTDLLLSQRKCATLPIGNQNEGAPLML